MSPRTGGRRGLVVVGVIVLALVGSAAATGTPGLFQQPSGEEVLERAHQRYETAETVTGTATVTVENDSGSVTATLEVAADSDNRSRTVVTHDGTTYRMGSNGTVVWVAGPNRSAAWPVDAFRDPEQGAFAGAGTLHTAVPSDHSDWLAQSWPPDLDGSNVTATVVGTPTVDGTDTYEVELSHPGTDGTASLWIARDGYRVVRTVATDGPNRTVVSVESTAFNVSIHDSTFDPPTDRLALSMAERYDGFEATQSATDLTIPRLNGTFAAATVTVRQGETIVAQRYVREEGNVTLVSTTATDRFERATRNASTVAVGGQTVAVTTVADRAVAAWTDDGVTTAVVVDGSTDRAVSVATELLS